MAFVSTKFFLLFVLMCCLAMQPASTQSCQIMQFNQACLMSEVMSCLSHSPDMIASFLPTQLYGTPNPNPSGFDWCGNTRPVAMVIDCLLEKLKVHSPFPPEFTVEFSILQPSIQQLMKTMNQVCANMEELKAGCALSEANELTQCISTEYLDWVTKLMNETLKFEPEEPLDGWCRYLVKSGHCFGKHHGKCSNGVVEMVYKVINIMFPFCDEVDVSKGGYIPEHEVRKVKNEL